MSAEQQGRVFRKELEENRGKKRKEKLHITDSPIKPNPLSAAKRPHSLTGAPVSLPHNNRGIKTKQQTQHTLALLDPVRPVFIYGRMRRLQTLVPIPPRLPSAARLPAPSHHPSSREPKAEDDTQPRPWRESVAVLPVRHTSTPASVQLPPPCSACFPLYFPPAPLCVTCAHFLSFFPEPEKKKSCLHDFFFIF